MSINIQNHPTVVDLLQDDDLRLMIEYIWSNHTGLIEINILCNMGAHCIDGYVEDDISRICKVTPIYEIKLPEKGFTGAFKHTFVYRTHDFEIFKVVVKNIYFEALGGDDELKRLKEKYGANCE